MASDDGLQSRNMSRVDAPSSAPAELPRITPVVVPSSASSLPSSNAPGSSAVETEAEMRAAQTGDRLGMKLIPILWEGPVRRKGDWLPRWEEMYMTLDGHWLRFYESAARYREAQDAEERAVKLRLPIGSPPHASRRGASSSARGSAFFSSSGSSGSLLGTSAGGGGTGGTARKPKSTTAADTATRKATAPPKADKRQHYLTVTAVAKEHAGRTHGFVVSFAERKPVHLAVDTELERVVWLHLLTAVLEQQKELARPRHQSALASAPTPALAALWRLLPPGMITRTLLQLPIRVNLVTFYEAWGLIAGRKGNFADLVPCLHPNVTITSNYPPSVPIAGEYHGREGVLCFFTNLHAGIDIAQYSLEHLARRGDLAVVTGWETVKNGANGRKFRHLWKHELRFEADGRISHINVIADKTAAAVAFGIQTAGPSLALPHEQEESAATCPPGEIRVVCIRGAAIRRKKPLPGSADVKVVIGLNGFPHLTLKAGLPHKSLSLNGACRAVSTSLCKTSTGPNPLWAETLTIQFSGAVPGTSTCLYVEVWHLSMIGDELVGCTKVNLAQHLVLSTGTEEEMAACAVPKWYELRRPEYFTSTATSPSRRSQIESSSSSAAAGAGAPGGDQEDSFGRLQLSISFMPYTEELEINDDARGAPSLERTPRHRKSFERLLELHEETEAKQRIEVERRSSWTSMHPLAVRTGSADLERAQTDASGNRLGPTEEMYTFTVASTKFRVYTRYQLIRAIGHGAYGVVIAASDQITGNSVAIKNIPKTFDDLVDAKRIVREIRLMRHLQHPNVVTVIDLMRPPSLATFDDTYIVTDLMETDLHRVINSQEPLSPDHIAYITYQMLCGLRYIHSAQIIHRDIKPSNILINRDCLVKICDFGLARGFETQDGESVELAMTEYVVTRWYRAPELLLASKYTPAIDVWAIGCILVEMFTRKALFPGHDHVHQLNLILQTVGSPTASEMGFITNSKAQRWMKKQAQQTPKSFTSICPTAPAEAIDLMSRLLTFDPRKRISVDEALAHPFLGAYRNPEMEGTSDRPFDFSFEVENGQKKALNKDALRCLIFEDICHFHPAAQEELTQFLAEQERQRVLAEEAAAQDLVDAQPRSTRAGIA